MITIKNRYDNISLKTAIINSANKELIDFLNDYIINIEEKLNNCNNLIISGAVGTGKTYLCKCFINDVVKQKLEFERFGDAVYNKKTGKYERLIIVEKRNIKALMINLYNLIEDIRKTYNGEMSNYDYKEFDILIIDEIGVQRNTDDERFLLYDIVNYRNENFKPTFIITNFKTEKEIAMVLGLRILDRIIENAKIIKLDGASWRRN